MLIIEKLVKGEEGKVVPVHSVMAYRGSEGVISLILNLGARWRWVDDLTPWLL
jgi:hypothetical protein